MTTLPPPMPFSPPVALSIAGSDSGGGAGISADLKTFAAHGVFGTLAVTAITAQDTAKVHRAVPVDPSLLDAQIDAVLDDFPVAVAKTGMLATMELLDRVVERAAAKQLPPLVVDPVMVSANGAALFEGDAAVAYRKLLPHALVLTLNVREAEALLGTRVRYLSDMRDAAKALHDLGPHVVVVKGGNLPGPRAIDVVAGGGELLELGFPMVKTRNTHGAGCTLAAAIAANLALGYSPVDSVRRARVFVTDVIVRSANWALGSGYGPLDHFGPLGTRRH